MSIAAQDIKIQEIDHMPDADAVDEVADNSAEDQAQRNLAGESLGIEVMPLPDQDQEGHGRDEGQNPIVAAEHAPGRAGVSPVDKFEKSFDDHLFLRVTEIFKHEQLGKLIEADNEQGDDSDAPVRIKSTHVYNIVLAGKVSRDATAGGGRVREASGPNHARAWAVLNQVRSRIPASEENALPCHYINEVSTYARGKIRTAELRFCNVRRHKP